MTDSSEAAELDRDPALLPLYLVSGSAAGNWITRSPRLATFRKFHSLSMHHLIKLQADIHHLHKRLFNSNVNDTLQLSPDEAERLFNESLAKLQIYRA